MKTNLLVIILLSTWLLGCAEDPASSVQPPTIEVKNPVIPAATPTPVVDLIPPPIEDPTNGSDPATVNQTTLPFANDLPPAGQVGATYVGSSMICYWNLSSHQYLCASITFPIYIEMAPKLMWATAIGVNIASISGSVFIATMSVNASKAICATLLLSTPVTGGIRQQILTECGYGTDRNGNFFGTAQ